MSTPTHEIYNISAEQSKHNELEQLRSDIKELLEEIGIMEMQIFNRDKLIEEYENLIDELRSEIEDYKYGIPDVT